MCAVLLLPSFSQTTWYAIHWSSVSSRPMNATRPDRRTDWHGAETGAPVAALTHSFGAVRRSANRFALAATNTILGQTRLAYRRGAHDQTGRQERGSWTQPRLSRQRLRDQRIDLHLFRK